MDELRGELYTCIHEFQTRRYDVFVYPLHRTVYDLYFLIIDGRTAKKRIDALQSRQLALRAIMASSDERAANVSKTERRSVKHTPTISHDTRRRTTRYNRYEMTLAALEAERMAQREERWNHCMYTTPNL